MTILVSGGTGFVGTGIVHALRSEGRPVRCLIRDLSKASKLASWGCELIEGDITDVAALRSAVEGCDRVIHFAGIGQHCTDIECVLSGFCGIEFRRFRVRLDRIVDFT